MILDIHSHVYLAGPGRSLPAFTEIARADLDFLKEQYNAAGITAAGFSTFPSVLTDQEILEENNYLREVAAEDPRVYQWVVIDPRNDETFRQADEILKDSKCLGIKIHPKNHQYSINEFGDKIYGYAHEKGAVVVQHPTEYDRLPEFADRYPNMTMIIAHLAGKDHVEAALAAKHGNIWVDTSGMASIRNNVVEYAVEKLGSRRILFGTDTYAAGFQRGRIEYGRLRDEDKENIFFRNALRLFPGKFDVLIKE